MVRKKTEPKNIKFQESYSHHKIYILTCPPVVDRCWKSLYNGFQQRCIIFRIWRTPNIFVLLLSVTLLKLNIFCFSFFLIIFREPETFKNEVYLPKPHLWGVPTPYNTLKNIKTRDISQLSPGLDVFLHVVGGW